MLRSSKYKNSKNVEEVKSSVKFISNQYLMNIDHFQAYKNITKFNKAQIIKQAPIKFTAYALQSSCLLILTIKLILKTNITLKPYLFGNLNKKLLITYGLNKTF